MSIKELSMDAQVALAKLGGSYLLQETVGTPQNVHIMLHVAPHLGHWEASASNNPQFASLVQQGDFRTLLLCLCIYNLVS